MKDTEILEKSAKLLESFFPFHREALKHKQPHIAVQAAAVIFVDQWKLTMTALNDVRSGGIRSLQSYVRTKFLGILALVNRLDENMSKNNPHYDSIHSTCDSLRQRLNTTARELSDIFCTYKDGDEDTGNHYVGLVREYLKEYNSAFYSVFPRAGLSPNDLAGLKSETMSLCNDVITAIRSLFTFFEDIGKIDDIVCDAEGDLRAVLEYLRIPGFVPMAKRRRLHDAPVSEGDLVTESEEKRITRRINKLIETVCIELEKEVPDERVDVVERIDVIEKALIDRLQKPPATALPDEAAKKKRGYSRLEEVEEEKRKVENQLLEAQVRIAHLEGKLANITNQFLSEERARALENMKTKLSEALKPTDQAVINDTDAPIEKKEVLNVFMVEERCCKCIALAEELDGIKEQIGQIVKVQPGDSITSAIESLIRTHKRVAAEYVELEASEKENKTKLEELNRASNEIVESIKKALEEKGIHIEGTDISQQLINAVQTMMDQHEKDIKNLDEALHEERKVSAEKEETLNSTIKQIQNEASKVAVKVDIDVQTTPAQVERHVQTIPNDRSNACIQTLESETQTPSDSRRPAPTPTQSFKSGQRMPTTSLPQSRGGRERAATVGMSRPQGNRARTETPPTQQRQSSGVKIPTTEEEMQAIITSSVEKVQEEVKEIKEKFDENAAILQKVTDWMKAHAKGVNIEGLSLAEALPLLMKAIEHAEEPLRSEVAKTQLREKQVESHMREFLEEGQKSGFLPETCDLSEMNLIDMLNVVNLYQRSVKEQVRETSRTIEDQHLEMEANKTNLLSLGARLKTVLLRDDVELDTENMEKLWAQVSGLLDELANGGVEKNFVAISDLNEITENTRKVMRISSVNPRQYLPSLVKTFEADHKAVVSAKRFYDPLEALFKGFDFQMESYNPESDSFKFLREKIFQLHLLLGSENSVIKDEKLLRVFKRLVSLASTLLSFIAASFLRPEDKERVYNQSLRSHQMK